MHANFTAVLWCIAWKKPGRGFDDFQRENLEYLLIGTEYREWPKGKKKFCVFSLIVSASKEWVLPNSWNHDVLKIKNCNLIYISNSFSHFFWKPYHAKPYQMNVTTLMTHTTTSFWVTSKLNLHWFQHDASRGREIILSNSAPLFPGTDMLSFLSSSIVV
jgi:hypothetical protein